MTISQSEAFGFVAYGFSLAFFSSLTIRQVVNAYQKIKFERQYAKHPRLVKYDKTKMCLLQHAWTEVKLALRDLPYGTYKVCTKCGALAGREDFMVSNEVLDGITEATRLAEERAELEKQVKLRIKTLTEGYVDLYIAKHFSSETNDLEFVDRLRKLANYSISAMLQASQKVADELYNQSKLDERYQNWPNSTSSKFYKGGNA